MNSSHIHPLIRKASVAFSLALPLLCANAAHAWAPKKASLMTKWAAQVDPKAPLPEYPRPQLVRKEWLNLNGIWEYQPGQANEATPTGQKLSSEILVPFPVDSALSGVMERHDRLWYRRNFTVPSNWRGQQIKLNFGAVDYEAEIIVNGQTVGTHKGGYEQFSYDITSYLKGDGPQELIVRVFDPTDNGGQPRGKQTLNPGGIMYTPTTGIWQTVWLEPVAKNSIVGLHMTPDIDAGNVKLLVAAPNASANAVATVRVKDGNRVISTTRVRPNTDVMLPVKNAKLWSPDNPFLYNVDVTFNDGNAQADMVSSYFGMRKISMGMVDGVQRLLLNNKFTFQIGPLDQGFWPDGIYTAPTDEALEYDIKATKELGFNMVRKHIKVEPARWYYHADKLGILVWQDMPSENSYTGNPQPLDKIAYEKQLVSVVTSHWNSPAIIMWVIFNEGQGYYDPARLVTAAKQLDPSRLVSRNSGTDYGDDLSISDIRDAHAYPAPNYPPYNPAQASVCGEYGGIGYLYKGHLYRGDDYKYQTYTIVDTQEELHDMYGLFTDKLRQMRDDHALSAAVYTEITDVETEINGLLTYDRIMKVDPAKIRLANAFKYPVPTYQSVVPTSEKTSQTYQYTFENPAPGWSDPNFAGAANWKTGPGGFGTAMTPGIGQLGTVWNTPDIWLRRTFTLPNLNAEQMKQLGITDYHDEDVEIYLNGVLAYSKQGFTGNYEYAPITEAARNALNIGGENVMVIHCRQTQGGQYIDAGLSLKIPAKPMN